MQVVRVEHRARVGAGQRVRLHTAAAATAAVQGDVHDAAGVTKRARALLLLRLLLLLLLRSFVALAAGARGLLGPGGFLFRLCVGVQRL